VLTCWIVKLDTPTERALLLGSFVMAVVRQVRGMSYRLLGGEVRNQPFQVSTIETPSSISTSPSG
jgi:hypothetical protein